MLGRERRGRKTRNMLQIFWKDLASTVKVTTLLASCEYTQLAMNRSLFFFFLEGLPVGLAELLLLMLYSLFFHPLLSFPSSFSLVSPCLSIVSFFFFTPHPFPFLPPFPFPLLPPSFPLLSLLPPSPILPSLSYPSISLTHPPPVPDVSLSGMDTSPQSLKTLLSALGLSQKRPTPRRFEFSNTDPLGEHLYKREHESGAEGEGQSGEGEGDGGGEEDIPEGVGVVKMGHTCGELVQQAQKLRSLGENFTAINRITAATQTLVARHVTMLVISTLSTQGKRDFISGLKALDLVDVKSLVRLLRLVHAGRIDGTPGKAFSVKTPSSLLPIKGLDCLGSAITAVVTESHSAGLQLMYACARDLLAAAVGGAELLQKGTRRRRRPHRRGHAERTPQFDWKEKSDLSTLSNPNFSVSQNLVQMMADMSGKMLLGNGSSVASSDGVLQITDALAACLFSSKLEPEHRFWGLEQLLKMFSSTSKEQLAKMNPQGDPCSL